MPANLDQSQQQIILTVTTISSIAILSLVAYAEWVEIPRLTRLAKKQQAENETIASLKIRKMSIFYTCLKLFFYMAISTFFFSLPIILFHTASDTSSNIVTSSINFCESDFRHTTFIAEPVNTISSIMAYLPLSALGALRSTTIQQRTRYMICYGTLFMIGVGSTLLHSFLTAMTQGGDELPMLWYTAATSFGAFDVIFSGIPGVGTFVGITAILSTLVYVQFRANFTYFYLMFTSYTVTLSLSLIYIALFKKWENRKNGAEFKRCVLLPLMQTSSITLVFAVWCWIAEMLGCEAASQQPTDTLQWMVWNRVLHPCWHFATAIAAFLVIQEIYAAEGFSKGHGMPWIVSVGAPFVVFDDTQKSA